MTESSFKKGLVSAFWLTVVLAAGWVVCFWPARWLRGSPGVWWMTIAAICCLVPGWIVVFLSLIAIVRNELLAMMIQMMTRLFMVAGVALAIKKFRPELGFVDFFGWLVGFYLLALVVEVKLLKLRA
ncbi:MAG: hypothetical protein O2856_16230 [Planctomycetota bacterium]|nr:hypothetical protein [Planctomycetota bacterium]